MTLETKENLERALNEFFYKTNTYKAKNIETNDWIEGDLLLYEDGTAQVKSREECWSYDVAPETICRCTGKTYMDSQIAWEGDIFESQVSGDLMILRYGTYQAFCPVDQQFMDSVGFYAECNGLPDMPIGDLKDYALKKGNIFDNPEVWQRALEEDSNDEVKELVSAIAGPLKGLLATGDTSTDGKESEN